MFNANDPEVTKILEDYFKNNPQFKNHYLQCLCKNNHYTSVYLNPAETNTARMENSISRCLCSICTDNLVWTNEVDPTVNLGFMNHVPMMVELGNYENMDKYDKSLDIYQVPVVGYCEKVDGIWIFELQGKTYEGEKFDDVVRMLKGEESDVAFSNEKLVEEKGSGRFNLVTQKKEKFYYFVF
jgi:hypothetical protein